MDAAAAAGAEADRAAAAGAAAAAPAGEDEAWPGAGDPMAAAWSFDPRIHDASAAAAKAPWGSEPAPAAGAAGAAARRVEETIGAALRGWLAKAADDGGNSSPADAQLRGFVAACLKLARLLLTWLQLQSRPALWALPPTGLAAGSVIVGLPAGDAPDGAPAVSVELSLPPPLPPLPASGAPSKRAASSTPLLKLQRIIRLGNLEPSSQGGGGRDAYGGAGAALGRGGGSAFDGAAACRSGCSISTSVRPLLAVCRGKAVGVMELTDHLGELTGTGQVGFKIKGPGRTFCC